MPAMNTLLRSLTRLPPRVPSWTASSSVRWISLLRPPGFDMNAPCEKTALEMVEHLSDSVIGGPKNYDPAAFQRQRESLMEFLPASQSDLPPRRMVDSFDQALIPLGSDPKLRDRYLTQFGGVRVGRLLEDMDIFAVHLVFKHMLNPRQEAGNFQSPFSIVTALVDRIDVKMKIPSDQDIKLMGHVTWVGKSSVEATLELWQLREQGWVHVTDATFVMVVRDPINKGSSFVNPLVVETEAEKAFSDRGERNKIARYAMTTESLFKNPPSEQEKRLIHDFFISTVDHKALSFKARVKPPNSVWMEDAKLKNILICQPEYRNRFNKIFGGFIMRQAFELAWANTFVYSGQRPLTNHMDDILFRMPVDVGSLLYFNSQICYTEGNRIQTRVSAEILDPTTGNLSLSNVFQYTFSVEGKPAPSIVPKSYHEAMMYLEGRRHFLNSTTNL